MYKYTKMICSLIYICIMVLQNNDCNLIVSENKYFLTYQVNLFINKIYKYIKVIGSLK
jgi:hypothetical protein